LLYNGPLLCGFNVPIKGLMVCIYSVGVASYGALGHVPPPWSLLMYTNLAFFCSHKNSSGQWWTASEHHTFLCFSHRFTVA